MEKEIVSGQKSAGINFPPPPLKVTQKVSVHVFHNKKRELKNSFGVKYSNKSLSMNRIMKIGTREIASVQAASG